MRLFIQTFGIGLLCLQVLPLETTIRAQEVKTSSALPEATQIAFMQMVEAQQQALSSITSISFEANSIFQISPDFVSSINYTDPTVKFRYLAAGNKFLYDVEDSSKSGVYIAEQYAYDGNIYQHLLKLDGILNISSKGRDRDALLVNKQYLFYPYFFVPQERLQQKLAPLSVQQFASQTNWNSLPSRAKNVALISNETGKFIAFETPGGTDADSNKVVTFKVVCDESLFGYPIKWSMVDDMGKLICEYTITKIGTVTAKNGVIFRYPKVARMKKYIKDKLASTITITISSIQFNAKIDDDQFMIDPAQADVIVDADHNTRVDVPK
jgi:hypothetical protein